MLPDLSGGLGCFIAVVGPSGAGKDSLIDAARRTLGPDGPIRFVTRVITRPLDAGGEVHVPLEDAAFREQAASGAFALHWQAHGLHYGIPLACEAHLAEGRSILANLSRGVIGDMRARYANRRVIHVTATPSVLAARLAQRGRESAAEIEARLSRTGFASPQGSDVVTVVNDGTLAEGISAFLAALEGL